MDENPYKSPQVKPMAVSPRWKRWLYWAVYGIAICVVAIVVFFVASLIVGQIWVELYTH
jgi:hypothetical protein